MKSGIRKHLDWDAIRKIQEAQTVMKAGVQKKADKKVEKHGHGFTEFVLMLKGDAEQILKVSQTLAQTVKYTKMFKETQGARMDDANPSDPKFQYLRQCQQDLNLCLPIFDKIIDKTLSLHSYTLSEGHCKAFKSACRFLSG